MKLENRQDGIMFLGVRFIVVGFVVSKKFELESEDRIVNGVSSKS